MIHDDIHDSSSLSSTSSESSDGENLFLIYAPVTKKIRVKDYIDTTVREYTDQQFFEHFRISRNLAEVLSNEFGESEHFKNIEGGYGVITPYKHLLVFLWFCGHQTASFRDVSDRFDISLSSLFRIIRRVTMFLSYKSNQVIVWPDENEKSRIESYFNERGFPKVIGAIDGSHIKIDTPSNDPESYFNRKHFYSIQIQAVCDDKKKIRDVFIGFPGSVHDARVFAESTLYNDLPNKCGANYIILGDSAYPCTRYLLTPYRDNGHLTRLQQRYNLMLSKNRYIIEHCFGILKQKFRQLYHLKLRNITDICHFIRACCVLHNLSIDEHFEYDLNEAEIQENENIDQIDQRDLNNADGPRYRDLLARELFENNEI